MPTRRKIFQDIVREQFTFLKNNLQVKIILAELFSAGIIESDQKIMLKKVCGPEEAADNFLDDLFQRVDEAKFVSFIRILTDSGDKYPIHLEMAELLQKSLQEANTPKVQNPTMQPSDGPTIPLLHSVSYTDKPSTQQSTSVLETSAPYSASTLGTAPNFPVDAKTVPGIDSTPQTSASLIYCPEDKEPVVMQEPEQSCSLDSYEHPGKDVPESDDSEEDSENELTSPGMQHIDEPKSPGNVKLLGKPESLPDLEPKPPDQTPKVTHPLSTAVKQNMHSEESYTCAEVVTLVCPKCYEALFVPQRAGTCTLSHPEKELLVKTYEGYAPVRAKNARSVTALCRCVHKCPYENNCIFAHSENELNFWKSKT